MPPKFTHCDLNPCNILARKGKVVGLIDWEFSGWYPDYWEYTSAWFGSVIRTDWQGMIVKYDLNRAIEVIANSMKDELAVVFDEQFGTDTENWKTVDLTQTVKMIVAQAASRFTVGLPLCRSS